jgi:hypothetical protein
VQREEDKGTGGCTGSDRAGLGVAYLNSCMQERWQLGCTTISIWSCCQNKTSWATIRDGVTMNKERE